jgi:hypothetical protein
MKMYGGVDVYIHVFLTSALVGGECSASHPRCFTLRKEPPVSTGQEAWWAPQLVWTTWGGEKSYPSWDSNSDLSVIQPVASHYTDCTILAHHCRLMGARFSVHIQ